MGVTEFMIVCENANEFVPRLNFLLFDFDADVLQTDPIDGACPE